MDKMQTIIAQYQKIPGGLIEAFHAVQEEYAYLSEEALRELAQGFGIPLARVYAVASFYRYLSLKPQGKYLIRICQSAPCHLKGAAAVVEALEAALGIRMGETTPDQLFTLAYTECVGACAKTPVITINGKPYGDLTPAKVKEILVQYRQAQ